AGTPQGLEARLVPAAGRTLHLLPGRQVRGGGARGVARGAIALTRGLGSALGLLRRVRPRLVVGLRGYASVAARMAAPLPSRGAATRSPGGSARRVCVGCPEAASFFPSGRAIHTGNPVRPEVLAALATPPASGLGLLIFGGSQGAHRLNQAGVGALEALGPI